MMEESVLNAGLAVSDSEPPDSVTSTVHICVCICTYRRLELLRRLLDRLVRQDTGSGSISVSCVVLDNDDKQSARDLVLNYVQSGQLNIVYESELERNFAVLRNRVVENSAGDYIAFIDDDEVPEEDWLSRLVETCKLHGADGALGPVRPYFENEAPRWLVRSGLCDRPVHPTGMIMDWRQTRTGNVLLRRDIFETKPIWFDPAYRTGGEDVDFFRRAIGVGRRFVWCEEAPAYELVPADRMRLGYHLRRALLQGTISLNYELQRRTFKDRLGVGLKSLLALVIYASILPVAALAGAHYAVRLLVKGCHHLGRFTALLGVPLIRERKL